MKKILLIGLKDLRLAFRDRAALIFMLLAPFLLTLGLGFVTGAFSGGGTSVVKDIPVVLVNLDNAQLGNTLVDVFTSKDLAELLKPQTVSGTAEARKLVDDDKIAAAVIIPAGFTASIIPTAGSTAPAAAVQVELYTNPTRSTSAGVVQTILEGFLSQVEVGRVGGQVAVTQLLSSGRVAPQDAARIGAEVGSRLAGLSSESTAIQLKSTSNSGRSANFNALAYMAPGMALFFLMFTVSNGGRSLLMERNQGTLPRLLISPTTITQVLGGKVVGIFLTGVMQMLILIIASAVLFRLDWGNLLGLLVLVMAAVAGATGWGMLITALSKTPGQAGSLGTALMLVFGVLGGSFFDLSIMPEWYRWIARLTPNAWGIEGFSTLGLGGGLQDIWSIILALLVMGAGLFTLSAFIIRRRNLVQV